MERLPLTSVSFASGPGAFAGVLEEALTAPVSPELHRALGWFIPIAQQAKGAGSWNQFPSTVPLTSEKKKVVAEVLVAHD